MYKPGQQATIANAWRVCLLCPLHAMSRNCPESATPVRPAVGHSSQRLPHIATDQETLQLRGRCFHVKHASPGNDPARPRVKEDLAPILVAPEPLQLFAILPGVVVASLTVHH